MRAFHLTCHTCALHNKTTQLSADMNNFLSLHYMHSIVSQTYDLYVLKTVVVKSLLKFLQKSFSIDKIIYLLVLFTKFN